MREDRRATRNRVYTLVAGGMMVIIAIVAMASFLVMGKNTIEEKLHRYPWKVLIQVSKLQDRFRIHDREKDGIMDYATSMEELEAAGLLQKTLVVDVVQGYRYEVRPGASALSYVATATPAEVTSERSLYYYVDQSGVVRANRGGPAGPESQVYWYLDGGRVWTDKEGAETAAPKEPTE